MRSTRAKPEQPSSSPDGERELLRARGVVAASSSAGHDEARAADLVARLEVVEVLLVRDRLDDRQRLRPVRPVEHRDREVAAGDVALEQHLRVVGEGGDQRARDVGGVRANLIAERRALARGLDDDREVEPLLDRRQRLGRAELVERRAC